MFNKGEIRAMVFSSNGLSLAISFEDGSVELGHRLNGTEPWYVKRMMPPMHVYTYSSFQRVMDMAFHPSWYHADYDHHWNGTFMYALVQVNQTQYTNVSNELYALNCTLKPYKY